MEAAATLEEGASDIAPFDALYRRHFPQVYLQCLRYAGGDKAWAEDVAHDVFVKLLEHQQELSDGGRVGAWLYRVAANTAISHLRRRRSFVSWMREAIGSEPEAAPSPAELLDERRRSDAALTMLRALPGKERVVVCMRLLDGRSQKDIADILKLSEGYVSKLMQRALERVRRAGWEVDDG